MLVFTSPSLARSAPKTGLGLLLLVTGTALFLTSDAQAQLHSGADLLAAPSPSSWCTGNSNCECIDAYELFCPAQNRQPKLIIRVQPTKNIVLHCGSVNQTTEDFQLARGLQIGPIPSFVMRMCPLPSRSFSDLISDMGVTSVRNLHIIYSNYTDQLTRDHFANMSELAQISLSGNALTDVPEDLFHDTVNLTWLDLKNNNLRLPKGIFRKLTKLEVLELGSNNLTYLEPGIFRNLTRLRLLNMWGNRLQNLSRSLFSDVYNLETMDLNSNGLVTLPPDIFSGLPKLKEINLSNNDFFALPQGLFLSNLNLEKFQMNSNKRTLRQLPPAFLANLPALHVVLMDGCNLTQLPDDLLAGSRAVTEINLKRNQLSTLPPGLIRDCPELKSIDLSDNLLLEVPDHFFTNQGNLGTLDLSNNQLTSLSENSLAGLADLETLRLQDNKIQYIGNDAFKFTSRRLRSVDLSYNRLQDLTYSTPFTDEFGQKSKLHAAPALETIYLSHNNISQIYSDWQISMTQLQHLDLSYNDVQNLTMADLQFISKRMTVDLTYNNISFIDFDTAEIIAEAKFADTPTTLLENESVKTLLRGNPLECDCRNFKLVEFLKGMLYEGVGYLVDLDITNLTCSGPEDLKGRLVKTLDPRELICSVDNNDQPCPGECSCFTRPSDSALVVDCSQLGLTEWPQPLPMPSVTFSAVTNHTELFLNDNQLLEMPGILGPGYENVTKIYLKNNRLMSVNLSALTSPYLEIIELDGNNLTTLSLGSIDILKRLSNLVRLTLQNNPWTCDCSTKEFLSFILNNFKKVGNFANITCSNGEYLTNLASMDLCPMTGVQIGIGSLVIATLGLLIGGLTVLYYRYQREIKVWLYAHHCCLWFVTEEELDKDKIYDAFVSYSHQDESFVVDKLVPGLENGAQKYKLCLHYRDWIVGDFIPNQIARSVEDSRRTIVVLSPNFIESIWGRMEFRTAHSKALNEGLSRVIVILYGDIGDTESLDPELKAYLSMNTYVKWGDPWFWDKLRYALPHPPEFTKGIPHILRTTSSSSKKSNIQRIVSDKLVTAAENGGSTTPPVAANEIIQPLKTLSNSKPV